MSTTRFLAPRFEQVVIEDNLKDGYWIQAVDITGNGTPDLVASGLAVGEVVWYENPTWKRRILANFPKPVALDAGDLDGDGHNDLVISHDFGNCLSNCGPNDGKISWLRNPGSFEDDRLWEVRHIGDLVAIHRLQLGRFTRGDDLELLALPVVGPQGGPEAVHKPVRATLYRKPGDLLSAASWPSEVVDESTFRVIHGVVIGHFPSNVGATFESTLLASEEGISWFGYAADGKWHQALLGTGEQTPLKHTGFKGSGDVAVGTAGADPYAYIATLEPFHGNIVSVYSKQSDGALTDMTWHRTVLDVFGEPNEHGEGAGHHVVTADFDGDGDDEFLVALRGPMPWQGVFYYKAVDVKNALWIKVRVSSTSAARIAVADFDGDGRLDFATTSYYTPGFFQADHPQVLVFLNRFADAAPK